MKKILFPVLCAAILLLGCQKKQAYKATLVELMAKGCPACEKARPLITEIQAEYKGLADVQVYDVTTEDGQEKSGIYGLTGTPTLIFLDENGIEYFRLAKTLQKDVIEAILNIKTGAPRPGR
jgi:thiol-disulfide isomerase/thioredoxin